MLPLGWWSPRAWVQHQKTRAGLWVGVSLDLGRQRPGELPGTGEALHTERAGRLLPLRYIICIFGDLLCALTVCFSCCCPPLGLRFTFQGSVLGSRCMPHLWAPALLPAVDVSSEMHVGLASKTATARHQDLTSDNCNTGFPSAGKERGQEARGPH